MSLLHEIVEKGDGIYGARYKRDCEQRYFGQYIALDLETGDGFIAAKAAIRSGQGAGNPSALFRLIRIGYKTGGTQRLTETPATAHSRTVEAPGARPSSRD